MRRVKPCRPSAAIDPHGGPPRLIMGEGRRERTPAGPDNGLRTGHTRSASVAWDNRPQQFRNAEIRSMPGDQRVQAISAAPVAA